MAGNIEVLPWEAFQGLFAEARIEEKRIAGIFVEIIADERPATNPRYAGGRSLIIKLLTPGGQHIATVHHIVMPDGSVPHTHGKDYTRRDCSRVRANTPEPPN